MTDRPARVAVVTGYPVHYNVPLFRRLAARPELDLTVLYSSLHGVDGTEVLAGFDARTGWGVELLGGYRAKHLPSLPGANPRRRWTLLGPHLLRELTPDRYDAVVVYGWSYPTDWMAYALARLRGLPYLIYSDTDVRDAGTTRSLHHLREAVLQRLCRNAAGALYCGTFNRDFYLEHGVPPDRLWFSPWSVETDRFQAPDRDAARRKLGLRADRVYLVSVGKAIERKHPLELIEHVAAMQAQGMPVGLIWAGSGPLEEAMSARVAELGVEDVHLVGFVDQAGLPEIYRAADVFILISASDPRATVVNEAMSAGLPVIVSTGTGVWGPGDLVAHGTEGYVVDPDSETEVLAAVGALLDEDRRQAAGIAATERIRAWGYDEAVKGWLEAIPTVAQR